MSKQAMNFRFDSETVKYLQGAVKNSGLGMTQYIEGLIQIDRELTGSGSWSKGCVITKESLVVVKGPYYDLMVSLIEGGTGILAAIPDNIIPLEKCLSFAKTQARKGEDIIYLDNDDIDLIYIQSPESLVEYLESAYKVDIKSTILGG